MRLAFSLAFASLLKQATQDTEELNTLNICFESTSCGLVYRQARTASLVHAYNAYQPPQEGKTCPFGPAFHGMSSNDLLEFEYLKRGPSETVYICLWLPHDKHSNYAWFLTFSSTLAEIAAHAIFEWSIAFGAPRVLMSNGTSHFKTEINKMVSCGLQTPHNFILL